MTTNPLTEKVGIAVARLPWGTPLVLRQRRDPGRWFGRGSRPAPSCCHQEKTTHWLAHGGLTMGQRFRTVARLLAVGFCVAALGCSSPTRPSVTVAVGQPLSPASDAVVSYYSQPVTLVVTTGFTTSGEPLTTVVEVATDEAFTSIAITKALTTGANGQTTVTLDRLNPATTYFWRVKTTAGHNPSVVSAPARLTIGPQLIIQAPLLVQPLVDSFPHKRPTFTVRNAMRTGPSATLTYTFEVSTDAGFTALLATGTVPEGPDQTSFTPGTDLVPGTTYVWRARASDASLGETSEFSPAQSFTTVFPDDGSYRYTLVVRSGLCGGITGVGGCSSGSPWPQEDLSFDGMLVVDGDTLRYPLPPATYFTDDPPLVFEMRRAKNRVEGRVAGTTPNGPSGGRVTTVGLSGAVVGQSDNRGRFDGTVDGQITLWRFGFPCDQTWRCSRAGLPWTLMPR